MKIIFIQHIFPEGFFPWLHVMGQANEIFLFFSLISMHVAEIYKKYPKKSQLQTKEALTNVFLSKKQYICALYFIMPSMTR